MKISKVLEVLAVAYVLTLGSAVAQEAFPNQPINLIVANPPGGAADLNARIVAEPWSQALKQPVVVLNKPGMGGAIGTAYVAGAKPDGYTTTMALSSIVVHPEAERISGRKPLYELDQMEPIALISADPMIVIVRTDSPWKTINDLINDAKANPGKFNYSSSGNFGPIHLSVEMLAYKAGVKFTQVPFGGGGPSLMALLGNSVDFTTAAPAVAAAQITAGKVRPLAVSSAKRLATFPDLPTYKEAGYDAEYYIWAGIYGPKGMPPKVVSTLRETVAQAVKSPSFINGMQKQNIFVDYRDAPEFKKFASEDGQRMLRLLKSIGKIENN